MKIEITAKNYTVNDRMRDVIAKKLGKLEKYFDAGIKAKVFLKQEKDTYTLELTIYAGKVMRSEVRSGDMYTNVDDAVHKIVRQITKHKTKLDDKFMKDFNKEKEFLLKPAPEDRKSKVVKKKTYELTPMSVEDAMVQLDLIGHDFYVFLNSATNRVNVIYRRGDGDVGEIETIY